jgi:hypothetical protein
MNCLFSRIVPLLLLSLLAGCTSAKQLAERNNERCAARGLQPNSDAYSECMAQLETSRDLRMETNRRALMERPPDLPTSR